MTVLFLCRTFARMNAFPMSGQNEYDLVVDWLAANPSTPTQSVGGRGEVEENRT